MTDLYDQATEREETERARAIERARTATALPFVGACYNCDAAVPAGHRFCDVDCRNDWEKRAR